jgi:MoaA/NifB/PqqE/SkfB family radical SAM enzyme
MKLSGLHLLLTYQCNFECDHCFVWGGPEQTGTMTLRTMRRILEQAEELGTIEWIYFEGGEPFMYYPLLRAGVRMASGRGFRVGIVTNSYWATEVEDAIEWLRPFAGAVEDLSISSDAYHGSEEHRTDRVRVAVKQLGIPVDVIGIAQPDETDIAHACGQLPPGQSAVLYRGRAAVKLTSRAALQPREQFTTCPWEDLREPGRVHVDPFGNLHVCQGISLGNLLHGSLTEICRTYDPESHPIVGPLLAGGPAELARRYGLACREAYADACHLCYESRCSLRGRFPDLLAPDQMYGVTEASST